MSLNLLEPTFIEQYVGADGRLTIEGVKLIQSMVDAIKENQTLVDTNGAIALAEAQILAQYGDIVSVSSKKKSLNKFGANVTVGTSFETVAQLQGTTANETFVTTNLIDGISSSSALDTTQTIVIEGNTVDGSGNLTFVVQDAVLAGQTEVTLTTPLARANRMYVKASGTFGTDPAALVGTVYVYDNTDGISAGAPSTAAATKVLILAGGTQSEKCATAISSTDYWLIDYFGAGVGAAGGSAGRVLFRPEIRDVANGGAWLPLFSEIVVSVDQNGSGVSIFPYLVVPKNHDFRVRGRTNANTAEVFAEVSGYLAGVIG